MKRKTLYTLIWCALLIAGVTMSAIPRIREHKKDKQIRAAAASYMQEKYGCTAELLEYEDHFDSWYLRMQTQGKEFWLFLSEDMQPRSDTLQYDEILAAFADRIRETYPNIRTDGLGIYNQPDDTDSDVLLHKISLNHDTQFDGTNLDALLGGCTLRGTVYSTGEEFADCELFQNMQQYHPDLAFVNFDTQEHLESFLAHDYVSFGFHAEDAEYCASDVLYAPHITQIWRMDEKGSRSISYPLKEGEGFLYCCPDRPDTAFACFENADENALSPSCQFDCTWKTVYVYLPADAVPEGAKVDWIAENPGGPLTGIRDLPQYGDYLVFHLSAGTNPTWKLVPADDSQQTTS